MKSILITGATGLIGSQFVKHFLSKGFLVVATYRNDEKFNNLKNDNEKYKDNLVGIKTENLLDERIADEIVDAMGKQGIYPEYLVNNACDTSCHRVREDGFSERECLLSHYTINVVLPYELSFKFANQRNSKLKKIINISSMYGVVPYNPNLYENPLTETPLQYSVSKAAMIHLTKELAIKFADKDIMVNCISYGGVEGRVNEEFKARFKKLTPLKRMMQPKETVMALDYLISDNSIYMTGHNLIVDGGRTVW